MQYEILTPPENYSAANDHDIRVLSQAQRKERDAYDAQLDALIDEELAGQQLETGVHDLEALLQDAPKHLQAELRQRFAQKLNAANRDLMQDVQPSEAQRKLLSRLKKAEAQMDMPKAKIWQLRALVMRNPQLLDVIIALANVLLRHGVTGIAKVAPNEIDAPIATPTSNIPIKEAIATR